tara:strand:- start:7 stop:567 length:561 start_codon:yes stop_codon:yes gene_type:complete
MSKSPINFGGIGAIGSIVSGGGMYGRMSDEQLRRQYDAYSQLGGGVFGNNNMFSNQRNAMQAEIQRRQMLGDFGMPQQGSGGGAGPAGLDPNNTSTTGSFSINPNANSSFAQEATGAPGSDMGNFSDGSEGYAVNRFGGFAGPTGGGTVPANVATENNFNPTTEEAAMQMFGNSTQFQPRKKLITL